MAEILDYNAIKELGGTYTNYAPSSPAECPSKSDVITTYSNVTVGGVQNNELVTEADLTIQNTNYVCEWTVPSSTIKVSNNVNSTNYAHVYSYSYPKDDMSTKTMIKPTVNNLPSWVAISNTVENNTSKGEWRIYFKCLSSNPNSTERSAYITATNGYKTSSPIKIWQPAH